MTRPAGILVVDDDPNIRIVLPLAFEQLGLDVTTCASGRECLEVVGRAAPDLIFLDLAMPDLDGLHVLHELRERAPDVPVVLITAFGGVDSAVQAIQQGAYDYLVKPLDLERLRLVASRALELRRLRLGLAEPRSRVAAPQVRLIGRHPSMVEVFKTIGTVTGAGNRSTVLITGETGVGKGLVARTIHEAGATRGEPFVTAQCAGVPETLIESELFGHERGAFTGASQRRPGRVEAAGAGTLFLDEVGEIPITIQPKLLRLLDSGEYERLGSNQTLRARCRFIAATNLRLLDAIERGRFRRDLYFRLNVFAIHVPPLRERREDIPLLCDHFLGGSGTQGAPVRFLEPGALDLLMLYDHPGNVRELGHLLERAVALGRGSVITASLLESLGLHYEQAATTQTPEHAAATASAEPRSVVPLEEARKRVVEQFERRYLEELLRGTGGNVTIAAERAGVRRQHLQRLMSRYALSSTRFRAPRS